MKALLLSLFIVLPAQTGDGVVAVFPVIDPDGVLTANTRASMAEYVSGLLGNLPDVRLAPRDDVKKVVAQQKSSSYDACYDERCQIELGKELAASKVYTLKVSKLGGGCFAKSQLVDLAKAASEWSGSVRTTCDESEVVKAFEALIEDFRLSRLGGVVSSKQASSKYRGQLDVTTNPAGATVLLDGKPFGRTPLRRETSADKHALAIRLEGYDDFSQMIVVRPGRRLPVKVDLVRQVGRLRVSSEPSGATVEIDGQPKGVTPLSLDPVSAGPARVRVALSGYVVWEKDARIAGNRLTSIDVKLDAIPARISVIAEPPGRLRIGDTDHGETPLSVDVSPGDVRLEVTRTGYASAIEDLDLEPGEQRTVNLRLIEQFEAPIDKTAVVKNVAGWGLVAASVAGVVTAVVFGVKAKNIESEVETYPAGDPALRSRIDDGHQAALAADLIGVGSVVVGVAGWLVLRAR